MRIIPVILIAILSLGITFNACSDQQKLTNLESELLSALIVNFQNIAEGSVNTDQAGNVLFLLKHIAHIEASVTSALAYAMVIDPEGRIIAHNTLGNTYSEGQKLDDEITRKVLTYNDSQKPYFQFFVSENGENLIDISLLVMTEEDESEPEGFVRIGIFRAE
jgi:hypothetical protein